MTGRKIGVLLALLGIAIMASGCVYLRLLRLKWQFSEFERYFHVDSTAGLEVTFKEPLLLEKDLNQFGIYPNEERRVGSLRMWDIVFKKRYPDEHAQVAERGNYDVIVQLGLTEESLKSVYLPEEYTSVIPPGFIVAVLKALGEGKVDHSERSITAEFQDSLRLDALRPPPRSEIVTLLGAPFEQSVEGPKETLVYRYQLTRRTVDGERLTPNRYWVELVFDRGTGELLQTRTELFGGIVEIPHEKLIEAAKQQTS